MLSITTRQLKMNSEVEVKLASLYDTDYQLWLMQTVAQLQARDFGQVDVEKTRFEREILKFRKER